MRVVLLLIVLLFIPLPQSDLQALIDATPAGGTLTLASGATYTCNCVVSKSITITGAAKVISPNADPALAILPKTSNVTLRGLEVTGSAAKIYDIVRIGTWQTSVLADVPANIVIDQCDIHGFATQEVQRGIAANGANVTITNSRIHEIHGTGYDTQAIAIWNGPGPFTIVDNYLAAAGENI